MLFQKSLYHKNDDYFSLKKTQKMIVFYLTASIAKTMVIFSKKSLPQFQKAAIVKDVFRKIGD